MKEEMLDQTWNYVFFLELGCWEQKFENLLENVFDINIILMCALNIIEVSKKLIESTSRVNCNLG